MSHAWPPNRKHATPQHIISLRMRRNKQSLAAQQTLICMHIIQLCHQYCTLPASPQLANGFEKHLNKVVKMMLAKKQLVHAHGHMGSFRLSKAMAAKEEKRLARKPRVMKVGVHKCR